MSCFGGHPQSTRKEKHITLLTAGDRSVAGVPEGQGAFSKPPRHDALAGSARTSVAVFETASEITASPVEWLWPGRIPMGSITVLAGDPGLGKSLLSLDLAVAVSSEEASA